MASLDKERLLIDMSRRKVSAVKWYSNKLEKRKAIVDISDRIGTV